MLRVAVGFVLILAGVMKMYDLWSLQAEWHPCIAALIACGEITLGTAIASCYRPRVTIAVGMTLFAVYASYQAYQLLSGQVECGCLGAAIKVHPQWVLIFDLVAIVVLALDKAKPSGDHRLFMTVSAISVVIAATLAIVSIQARTVIAPATVAVGDMVAGTQIEVPVRVHNIGDKTITIVGNKISCSCIALDLPVDIPPHSFTDIVVHFAFKGSAGRFEKKLILYTNDSSSSLTVRLTGSVLEDRKGE